MIMCETIDDFLCAVEKKEIEIGNFNTNNIEIYHYCREAAPIVNGDFDSVYEYLDQAKYLYFNVEKVVVQKNAPTKIYITYLDVEPVLEKKGN